MKLEQQPAADNFYCIYGDHVAYTSIRLKLDDVDSICDGCIITTALRITSLRKRNDNRTATGASD